MVGDLRGEDGGGEGGGGGADARRGGRAGGRAHGRAAHGWREGVVRRRWRRLGGPRARRVRAGDTGVGAHDRAQDRRPRQGAAAGCVGGPVLRARRGEGGHAANRTAGRDGEEEDGRATRGSDGD